MVFGAIVCETTRRVVDCCCWLLDEIICFCGKCVKSVAVVCSCRVEYLFTAQFVCFGLRSPTIEASTGVAFEVFFNVFKITSPIKIDGVTETRTPSAG